MSPRRASYELRKSSGRCVQCCKAPPMPGRVVCKGCSDTLAANSTIFRHRRKAAGKCVRCGAPAVNASHCETHRLEHNAYCNARYYEQKRTA